MKKEYWEQPGNWFDLFKFLGVTESSSISEIKKNYHRLAKELHPDSNNGNREEFEKLKIAYETLIDSNKKKKYIEFTKKLKKGKKGETKTDFNTIVNNYKNEEDKLILAINEMINNISQREEKFFSIYKDFCLVIITNSFENYESYEKTRLNLSKYEKDTKTSIEEIFTILDTSLKNVNLKPEREKLRGIYRRFSITEEILNSSFKKARLLLLVKTKVMRKRNLVLAPLCVALIAWSLHGKNPNIEEILNTEITSETEYESETTIEENDLISSNNIEEDITSFKTEGKKFNFDAEYDTSCILFQDRGKDIFDVADEFDYISDNYFECGYSLFDCKLGKKYYLVDSNTNKVIMSNFVTYGGPWFYGDDIYVLALDGYDYTIDTHFTEIKERKSAYIKESEPYYLEGYGYVIDASYGEDKYIIDAETRYPLIEHYDELEVVYDEYNDIYYYIVSIFDEKYAATIDKDTKQLNLSTHYDFMHIL